MDLVWIAEELSFATKDLEPQNQSGIPVQSLLVEKSTWIMVSLY